MGLLNILKEVRILQQEGKLHKPLVNRVRMLLIISLVLAGVLIFNITFREISLLVALLITAMGFLLGLLVFSRMSPVNWNEEEETVQTSRMDKIGYLTLGSYILFEIGLRTFLSSAFPVSSAAYLFAGIFGTLFGRAVGIMVNIHKVFLSAHPKKEGYG